MRDLSFLTEVGAGTRGSRDAGNVGDRDEEVAGNREEGEEGDHCHRERTRAERVRSGAKQRVV